MSETRPTEPVRERAERVRRRELERALAALDDPTDTERAVLCALSRRLADAVAEPFADGPPGADRADRECARRLFLPDD